MTKIIPDYSLESFSVVNRNGDMYVSVKGTAFGDNVEIGRNLQYQIIGDEELAEALFKFIKRNANVERKGTM